jgi:hypothetical protein
MRPYQGKVSDNTAKRIYNYHLCRVSRIDENAFGILPQKFRIYNGGLQAKPENAAYLINFYFT